MTPLAVTVCTLLLAYLLGAIPFGYLVARWHGVDILHQGSGNIGATNVGRVLGRRWGILVFLLDFAKGAVPTALATWLEARTDWGIHPFLPPDGLRVAAGMAAFLGHLFPVYLRFRGGKGVATGAGVVTVLLPLPLLMALLIWIAVLCATRTVSLASVVSAAALAAVRFATTTSPFAPENAILTSFCLLAAFLVVTRHHSNLRRVFQGKENRLKDTRAMLLFTKIVHVLALGLWFGATVFFTFSVALTLFSTFEAEAEKPRDQRAIWFPLPTEFDRDAATRKEQGTRAAGVAISPLFDHFFAVQAVCGVLALATALAWYGSSSSVHKARVILLGLALVTVAVGWWLERKVSDLRLQRTETADQVLRSAVPAPEAVQTAATEARAAFGRWHLYSLLLNFVTILLVSVAMALAAQLPSGTESPRRHEGELSERSAPAPRPDIAAPSV
jgi:acyl-phosphate glycerol 3-phosphate acyltransferase